MAFTFIAQKNYLTFEEGRAYISDKTYSDPGIVIKENNKNSIHCGAELMWVPVYLQDNEDGDEHFMRVELNIISDLMDAGVINIESNLITFK